MPQMTPWLRGWVQPMEYKEALFSMRVNAKP